jgi:type II secretory pathway predicted ATPase ExeA
MYEGFYGLTGRPFLTIPNPEFLFWAESHTLAFTMLRYGLMSRAPITVVTGEIGAGKTTLIRQLLSEIPQDLVVGLVSNMQAGRGQLMHWVLSALNIRYADEPYPLLLDRFNDHVITAYGQGKRVVLIFDEAQNLSLDSLEELRMLSNINADKDELLQLVLVGQPELRAKLQSPELAQFAQRVSADFHLTALNAEEVERYIDHRLSIVGARWRIFPRHTCKLVHEATHGVPRLINVLCDMCLVYGFAAESKVIDESLLRDFLSSARKHGVYQQFSPLTSMPALVRKAN